VNDVDLVQSLLQPAAYPWRPETVDLIETHISWVFLAGDYVVKVKRPVVFSFVDHSTLERRKASCLDEVRLNRRLTDNVYLDVVPIVQTEAGCYVSGAGAPIEWATLMRRLPAAGMLDALLRGRAAPANLSARLAARLIPFHRENVPDCGRTNEIEAAATRVVTDNLDELTPFAGAPLCRNQFELIANAMWRFVTDQHELLQHRAAAGWIREGHGDLRTEHVCLEPGGAVQIFDCVEFNRDLRCADVASDLAFLLMDLTRYGAPAIAAALLARYRAAGIDLPDTLLRFYGAHRALVRGKIACLGLATAAPENAVTLAVKAADYLDLATAAAVTVPPLLVAMTGLSGSGKSTVAERLARALGARLFASDRVRKELAGIAAAAPAAWGEGLYRAEWTSRTYDRLFTLAASHLAAGSSVVLDATFLSGELRQRAAEVSRHNNARLVLVETVCDEATVAARLAARARRGDSPSDATLETYRQQRDAVTQAPPPIPDGAVAIQIDTAGDLPISLAPLFAALGREGLVRPVVPPTPAWKLARDEA